MSLISPHLSGELRDSCDTIDMPKKNMDRVFVDNADSCGTVGFWSVFYDHTQLHAILSRAAEYASQSSQAALASLVLPVPDYDPLLVFRAFRRLYADERFYWEQPARQMALVGARTELEIETTGAGRFADASRAWKKLGAQTVIHDLTGNSTGLFHGPVLFGGFRFDPLRPLTPLWQDFPEGLLILPRLLFHRHARQTTLTVNRLVRASDDLDLLAAELSQEMARFVQAIDSLDGLAEAPLVEDQDYTLRDIWSADNWKKLVGRAVDSIHAGKYAKIVLAREVEVEARKQSFTLAATLVRLRQHYPGSNVFALSRGTRTFLGATPERLIRAQDGTLHTMALAGSAPRGETEEEDLRLGNELLNSPKNREEHEIVASSVRNALARLCSRVWVADAPELLLLKNIQHLQTAIVGELLPGRSILEALEALHPTPAVGGSPSEPALAFIREQENMDRGWYAGPIGWVDLQGNGEFAVALRSALLEKQRARLFAGCGIVADSDPEAEYAESCLKLQVILRSLSGEEAGED